MDWLEMPHERRRTMRVRSKGSVRIGLPHAAIRARVLDLSVDGMLVCADGAATAVTSTMCHGDRASFLLRLDARPETPFALTGWVRRAITATSPTATIATIAVELHAIPQEFEDLVHDELLAAVEHDARPQMVLVDSLAVRRRRFASAFRDAGCHVTEAATPLDAIVLIAGAQFEPGVIAIADTVPESVADELRRFLVEQYPDARMVALGHPALDESMLVIGELGPDLFARVRHAILPHDARPGSSPLRTDHVVGRAPRI